MSIVEYLVCLVRMNRLSACRDFAMCIVGKMAQDVGMV